MTKATKSLYTSLYIYLLNFGKCTVLYCFCQKKPAEWTHSAASNISTKHKATTGGSEILSFWHLALHAEERGSASAQWEQCCGGQGYMCPKLSWHCSSHLQYVRVCVAPKDTFWLMSSSHELGRLSLFGQFSAFCSRAFQLLITFEPPLHTRTFLPSLLDPFFKFAPPFVLPL
jgi:hypothetical protein